MHTDLLSCEAKPRLRGAQEELQRKQNITPTEHFDTQSADTCGKNGTNDRTPPRRLESVSS